jgi:hypothetical protein
LIKHSTIGVRNTISQFSPFINRTGGFGGAVTAYPTGKRELFKEFLQPLFIFTFIGIHLRIGSLKVTRGKNPRRTVTRTVKIDGIEIVLFNYPITMSIDKTLACT